MQQINPSQLSLKPEQKIIEGKTDCRASLYYLPRTTYVLHREIFIVEIVIEIHQVYFYYQFNHVNSIMTSKKSVIIRPEQVQKPPKTFSRILFYPSKSNINHQTWDGPTLKELEKKRTSFMNVPQFVELIFL